MHESTNKLCNVTKLVKFHVDDKGDLVPTDGTANPFKEIVSNVKLTQTAVVYGLFIKFVQNDFENDIIVTVSNLYDSVKDNDEDEHELLKMSCPASSNKLVHEPNDLIYASILPYQDILLYADTEDVLLVPTQERLLVANEEPDDQEYNLYYAENHPLVSCLATDKDKLKAFKVQVDDGVKWFTLNSLGKEVLESSFTNSVFKNIHYTRFDNCKIETNLSNLDKDDKRGISVLLQLNYVLTQTK